MRLAGKVALVTGASRGIGRAIAERLAADGALVAVHFGRNREAAAKTVKAIEQAGGNAFAVKADLASLAAIEALYKELDLELFERTGHSQFDILVNNAAIYVEGTIDQVTEEHFDQHFDTNVKGPFFLTKMALSRLRGGGRVINISSVASRNAYLAAPVYSMTKGAMDSLMRPLAKVLGERGITVNTLAPGVTETDMTASWLNSEAKKQSSKQTALGRVAQPEDIANAVALLASADSGWVTGQYIEASGGLRL